MVRIGCRWQRRRRFFEDDSRKLGLGEWCGRKEEDGFGGEGKALRVLLFTQLLGSASPECWGKSGPGRAQDPHIGTVLAVSLITSFIAQKPSVSLVLLTLFTGVWVEGGSGGN